MKESVRLQLGRACLYAGFWSIIAQALCHLPAYITHPSSRDVVFLFYFSGDFYPSKLSSYHIHIFFSSEIHPCPFQTSTNKLPKQCQSKWWQLKISITSEASLRWEVKEFKQSSNVLYIFCIAAVGLKLRQSISLHHPLETVKAAKQTGGTNPAKAPASILTSDYHSTWYLLSLKALHLHSFHPWASPHSGSGANTTLQTNRYCQTQ